MRLLHPSALPTLRAAPRPRSKACARVVLHRPKTTRYTATMEPGAASQEQADFNNVAVTRYAAAGHNGSAAVARLGLGSGQQTGPAKTLQVAKGDTITFTAYAWLTAVVAGASNSTSPKNPPLVLPAPQPNTAPPAAPGADGAPTKRSGLPTVGISVALPIGGPDDATPQGGGAPGIARLHYRVLDAQGTVLLDDYQTANGAAPATWQTLQVGLRLAQAGSVQLSVETNGAAGPTVYFDDVSVEQTGGLIVQEQHQYAFGAPLPGLSYTVGSTRYRHGYQGQFADKDEETGFDSFELRLYNSRIGRWMAPDPYGQFDSPYVGMGNNPVMGTDPDGGWMWSWVGAGIGAGIGAVAGGIIADQNGGSFWKGAAIGGVAGALAGGIIGGIGDNPGGRGAHVANSWDKVQAFFGEGEMRGAHQYWRPISQSNRYTGILENWTGYSNVLHSLKNGGVYNTRFHFNNENFGSHLKRISFFGVPRSGMDIFSGGEHISGRTADPISIKYYGQNFIINFKTIIPPPVLTPSNEGRVVDGSTLLDNVDVTGINIQLRTRVDVKRMLFKKIPDDWKRTSSFP